MKNNDVKTPAASLSGKLYAGAHGRVHVQLARVTSSMACHSQQVEWPVDGVEDGEHYRKYNARYHVHHRRRDAHSALLNLLTQ